MKKSVLRKTILKRAIAARNFTKLSLKELYRLKSTLEEKEREYAKTIAKYPGVCTMRAEELLERLCEKFADQKGVQCYIKADYHNETKYRDGTIASDKHDRFYYPRICVVKDGKRKDSSCLKVRGRDEPRTTTTTKGHTETIRNLPFTYVQCAESKIRTCFDERHEPSEFDHECRAVLIEIALDQIKELERQKNPANSAEKNAQ